VPSKGIGIVPEADTFFQEGLIDSVEAFPKGMISTAGDSTTELGAPA